VEVRWDESFFQAQQQDASVYWVCFWTGDDIERSAQHDPQRVTGADSIEEVLAWISRERGERRFELFVEAIDHAGSRGRGCEPYRNLVRLAGDFRPGGVTVTIPLSSAD
jgi:hypothetical protein